MCSNFAENTAVAGRLAVVLAGWLAGCTLEAPDPGRASSDTAVAPGRVVIVPGAPQAFSYTTVDSVAFDLDRDGVSEQVQRLATVERSARGGFLWEDGHHWAVLVRHDSLSYVLVERFVPNGYVELYTILDGASQLPVVLVQTRSGAGCGTEGGFGLSLEKFTFDTERRVYLREAAVEASGQGACRGGAP